VEAGRVTAVLLVGDIHISDKAPASATESYTDDLIDMLKWIANYAHSQHVKNVIWAGDIFHHKQPSRTSHATILRMLEVIELHKSLGIELRIVVGNHDISNDVLDSVHEKQPLGVLLAAGARELNGWHETLPIFGVPWQQRWLHEDTPAEAFQMWRAGASHGGWDLSKCLTVTHAPIYPTALEGDVLFDLVPTTGEHGLGEAMEHQGYLYYGHIHEDHGIWESEGVTYANMGALSRGSLHEYNLERKIKVALWTDGQGDLPDIVAEDYVGFTEIPVPHKPASEVFRLAEVMEERSQRMSLDKFLGDVGSRTLDISSTASVIEHIRTTDVTPRVKALAIEILEGVEQ
jgi:Icc-related predicted phosphoesterase